MTLTAIFASSSPSPSAMQVDNLFLFILVIAIFFFILTQGALIYFALKYRKSSDDAPDKETPRITHSSVLEVIWIVIPSIVLGAVFYYGYVVYMNITRPIPGASEIHVTAKQWLWEFEYPDGRKAMNELRLVLNKPTHLVMTSKDVIHSFYIPDFRLKMDVVPGRFTDLWFTPEREGTYAIYCAEYCGLAHSKMEAKLIVMSEKAYAEWLAGNAAPEPGESLAGRGEAVVKNSGCLNCHSVDGSIILGPSFKGIYGRSVELTDGSTITVDDNYIMESVIDPKAKVAKGFQDVMPSFKGSLSEDEVKAVIEHIKTIK